MLPNRSSTLSGHIQLFLLTLAVLVVLAWTSPDGWLKTCAYGMGKCRSSCREVEKKKERCGNHRFCCVRRSKSKLSNFPVAKRKKEGYC